MEQGRAEAEAAAPRLRTRVPARGPRPLPGRGAESAPAAASGGRPSGAGKAAPSPTPPAWGTVPRPRVPGPGAPSPGLREDEAARGEHGHSEPQAPSLSPGAAGAVRRAPRRLPQRHSVRRQVLDALRNALVGGDLAPGEVYSAPALAERFGVSATPVREAMQQLACEGAVEVVPNRGFRVARRTARDLAELAEVRALIEVPVMLALARSTPPERWGELRPLAARTVAAAARGDRVAYAESDRIFHHALLSLTGNRQLTLLGDDLHRRSQGPVADGATVRTAGLLAAAAEHTALLDALAAQDLSVIERVVREHFTGVHRTR